ncbi:pathway-specific nitrogen regulator [Colletotrichum incanum]|uniref:Pathway-specific nitrogen regulator n=1 Tax=Colletotrichum incanum TaxID=1573173 RepID=A0A161XXF8_COLIC|nr:pathway-specific nitrogen regulator [Colletotrichum incanum]OHW91387.1 pathway-specific nitrogen regulator [Colletotrichum incanum]
MPRSGPKPDDLDFEIHVDPSCLSTPAHEATEPELMDDNVPTKPEEEKVQEVEVEDKKDNVKDETPVAMEEVTKPESRNTEEENTTRPETAEAVAEDMTVEAEKKDDDSTAPEATPEPAAEGVAEAGHEEPVETKSEEAEAASKSTNTADENVEEAEVTPTEETDTTTDAPADETTIDILQDKPEQADAKSEKDLAEETSELAAVEDATPEEPEPEPESEPAAEAEPIDEAEKEEPPQAESKLLSEDQPQEVIEEEPAPEEPEPQVEEEVKEEEPSHPEPEAAPETEVEKAATPEPEPEVKAEEEVERGRSLQPAAEITASALAKEAEEALAIQGESEETPTPAPAADEAEEDHDEPVAVQEASRSSSSLRRASGRTEALIQAAAKEVLERLEAQTMETIRNRSHSRQDSTGSTNAGTELHYGTRSEGTRRESYATESRASRRESYNTQSQSSRRESYNTRPQSSRRESDIHPVPVHAEDGADSSSQHGDSDVFSDRSPRSSLGSFDGHIDHHKDTSHRSSKRSSRMSDVSVSEMSYYDKEEFVPTIRGTNRMPFRSPSDVRALQYSSPAPSVTGSYSPHSNKRPQMPTISRLGSPTVSAQYTTKGRKTPTRFNPKKEPAPLVLLHVTLLPLRWQWAEILEQASSDTLSPEAKTLREAWHHLHDRVADTVCERGILLSHPQDDYEILEERLLEALDLPLRRRARVLECGHYIGPANEMTLGEDTDSDEEEYDEDSRRRSALVKTHWCQTCRHDIRYESLGPGKIFRIKVYASNGLMRTGAWAACWKEMERVDVEIEPIVESAVLDELERLAISQSQQLQLVKHDPTILESTEGRDLPKERGMSDFDRTIPSMDRDMHSPDRGIPALEEPPREASHLEESNLLEPKYIDHEAHIPVSSPPPAMEDIRSPSPEPMPRYDESEERRLRDEERMREIYGHPPPEPQHHEAVPEPQPEPRHESFSAQSPPPPQQQPEPQAQPQQHYHQDQQQHQSPPPAQEAYPPHHERQQAFQNAGLGELLLEAARVFMQDKKNLAIVVMSLLVLFMAVRPAPREVRDWDGQFVEHVAPVVSEPPVSPPLMETIQSVVESVTSSETPVQVVVQSTPEVEAREVEVEAPVAEATASTSSVEPAESSSTSVTAQTSAVEEETPSLAPSSSSSSEEAKAPAPIPVHETITTRELVRIIETVTETVKAVVTETEVVRVQATPSVAPEVPVEEAAVLEEAAAQAEEEVAETEDASPLETTAPVDEPLEDATVEEAPVTETTLPVEEPVDEQVAEEQETIDEVEQVERGEMEGDDHDEL